MVCAEAYQVIGCLLSDLGLFETEQACKILDNLAAARRVHHDVLPWDSAKRQEQPQQERKPLTRADYENKSEYLGCTSAAMRHGFESGVRFAERMHGIWE